MHGCGQTRLPSPGATPSAAARPPALGLHLQRRRMGPRRRRGSQSRGQRNRHRRRPPHHDGTGASSARGRFPSLRRNPQNWLAEHQLVQLNAATNASALLSSALVAHLLSGWLWVTPRGPAQRLRSFILGGAPAVAVLERDWARWGALLC